MNLRLLTNKQPSRSLGLTASVVLLAAIFVCTGVLTGCTRSVDISGQTSELPEKSSSDFEYTVSKRQVKITRCSSSAGELEVPAEIDGYPVVCIGERAFADCTALTSITLPDSITDIEACAFYNCASLAELELPKKVKTIGAYAFYGCSSLTDIVVPIGVEDIEDYTFYGCSSLKSFHAYNYVKTVGDHAFSHCSSLERIFVSILLRSIGKEAFSYCTSATYIDIPLGITNIEERTFYGCSSLESILIPSTVKNIGDYAFSECSSLKEIIIPDSVLSVGYGAFSNCSSASKLKLSSELRSIGDGAFSHCSSLTNVRIPDKTTYIGLEAFYGCEALKEVSLREEYEETNLSAAFPEDTHFTFRSMELERHEKSDLAALQSAEVGDIVYYGAYEQDNDLTNGKENIAWLVLDKQDGKLLLISQYILDSQPFNTVKGKITWDKCSLRKWLNDYFINAAFSFNEQARILTTEVTADKNPYEETDPGENSDCKIFLLSVTEAEKYFKTDEDRLAAPTAYAFVKSKYLCTNPYQQTKNGESTCTWFLRTPGISQFATSIIFSDGSLEHVIGYAYIIEEGIRPVLWLNIED